MIKKLVFVMMLVCAPVIGFATERGTAEEASAMVDRAISLFEEQGLEALVDAVNDPNNTNFHDRDLYVMIGQLEGNLVAHGANPALAGRDLSGLQDANGKKISVEMQNIATTTGDGWVDYVWPNPATKQIEAKSTRVVRFGDKYYAAVGAYKE